MRKEVRISGFGGQGIVLAGYVLGKALALYDGCNAVMTQSYGPEARGGASSANIVISDEPIDFPFVQHPDVLVVLSQEAYSKFHKSAKPDALILIDEDLVLPDPGDETFKIPATRFAEELGKRIVANIVMVGFFTGITGLVSHKAVLKAISDSVKPSTVDLNIDAFQLGLSHASIQEQPSMHQCQIEQEQRI